LKNGKAVIRIAPGPQFTCKKENLNDGKWHTLQIFCIRSETLKVMIDGDLSYETSDLDYSELDTCTGICIGYCSDIKHLSFTGCIRTLLYEEVTLDVTFPELFQTVQKHREDVLKMAI
jgi:hypothetical protein